MQKDTCNPDQFAEYEAVGNKVLDEYMEAFNSGSVHRWASALHYPHVRLAGDRVMIWNNPTEFTQDNDVVKMRKKIHWGYNKIEKRQLVQFDPGKMHYIVKIGRYTDEGKLIVAFESLYVLTRVGVRWGVQCRSSYGGIFEKNTGY